MYVSACEPRNSKIALTLFKRINKYTTLVALLSVNCLRR